jgi:hypothetical protein
MVRRKVFLVLVLLALANPSGASGPPPADGRTATTLSGVGAEAERQKIALRRSVATSLRDEAYALQQRGQLREAVIRYRQSLVYWPDSGLESFIVPLEKKAGFTVAQYRPQDTLQDARQDTPQAAASPSPAAKPGIVFATVRNRSNLDIAIRTRGEPPESATVVRAGEILIRPVQPAANGEVMFYAERNGQAIVTRSWFGDPRSTGLVPAVLYDDGLPERLVVMTGLR